MAARVYGTCPRDLLNLHSFTASALYKYNQLPFNVKLMCPTPIHAYKRGYLKEFPVKPFDVEVRHGPAPHEVALCRINPANPASWEREAYDQMARIVNTNKPVVIHHEGQTLGQLSLDDVWQNQRLRTYMLERQDPALLSRYPAVAQEAAAKRGMTARAMPTDPALNGLSDAYIKEACSQLHDRLVKTLFVNAKNQRVPDNKMAVYLKQCGEQRNSLLFVQSVVCHEQFFIVTDGRDLVFTEFLRICGFSTPIIFVRHVAALLGHTLIETAAWMSRSSGHIAAQNIMKRMTLSLEKHQIAKWMTSHCRVSVAQFSNFDLRTRRVGACRGGHPTGIDDASSDSSSDDESEYEDPGRGERLQQFIEQSPVTMGVALDYLPTANGSTGIGAGLTAVSGLPIGEVDFFRIKRDKFARRSYSDVKDQKAINRVTNATFEPGDLLRIRVRAYDFDRVDPSKSAVSRTVQRAKTAFASKFGSKQTKQDLQARRQDDTLIDSQPQYVRVDIIESAGQRNQWRLVSTYKLKREKTAFYGPEFAIPISTAKYAILVYANRGLDDKAWIYKGRMNINTITGDRGKRRGRDLAYSVVRVNNVLSDEAQVQTLRETVDYRTDVLHARTSFFPPYPHPMPRQPNVMDHSFGIYYDDPSKQSTPSDCIKAAWGYYANEAKIFHESNPEHSAEDSSWWQYFNTNYVQSHLRRIINVIHAIHGGKADKFPFAPFPAEWLAAIDNDELGTDSQHRCSGHTSSAIGDRFNIYNYASTIERERQMNSVPGEPSTTLYGNDGQPYVPRHPNPQGLVDYMAISGYTPDTATYARPPAAVRQTPWLTDAPSIPTVTSTPAATTTMAATRTYVTPRQEPLSPATSEEDEPADVPGSTLTLEEGQQILEEARAESSGVAQPPPELKPKPKSGSQPQLNAVARGVVDILLRQWDLITIPANPRVLFVQLTNRDDADFKELGPSILAIGEPDIAEALRYIGFNNQEISALVKRYQKAYGRYVEPEQESTEVIPAPFETDPESEPEPSGSASSSTETTVQPSEEQRIENLKEYLLESWTREFGAPTSANVGLLYDALMARDLDRMTEITPVPGTPVPPHIKESLVRIGFNQRQISQILGRYIKAQTAREKAKAKTAGGAPAPTSSTTGAQISECIYHDEPEIGCPFCDAAPRNRRSHAAHTGDGIDAKYAKKKKSTKVKGHKGRKHRKHHVGDTIDAIGVKQDWDYTPYMHAKDLNHPAATYSDSESDSESEDDEPDDWYYGQLDASAVMWRGGKNTLGQFDEAWNYIVQDEHVDVRNPRVIKAREDILEGRLRLSKPGDLKAVAAGGPFNCRGGVCTIQEGIDAVGAAVGKSKKGMAPREHTTTFSSANDTLRIVGSGQYKGDAIGANEGQSVTSSDDEEPEDWRQGDANADPWGSAAASSSGDWRQGPSPSNPWGASGIDEAEVRRRIEADSRSLYVQLNEAAQKRRGIEYDLAAFDILWRKIVEAEQADDTNPSIVSLRIKVWQGAHQLKAGDLREMMRRIAEGGGHTYKCGDGVCWSPEPKPIGVKTEKPGQTQMRTWPLTIRFMGKTYHFGAKACEGIKVGRCTETYVAKSGSSLRDALIRADRQFRMGLTNAAGRLRNFEIKLNSRRLTHDLVEKPLEDVVAATAAAGRALEVTVEEAGVAAQEVVQPPVVSEGEEFEEEAAGTSIASLLGMAEESGIGKHVSGQQVAHKIYDERNFLALWSQYVAKNITEVGFKQGGTYLFIAPAPGELAKQLRKLDPSNKNPAGTFKAYVKKRTLHLTKPLTEYRRADDAATALDGKRVGLSYKFNAEKNQARVRLQGSAPWLRVHQLGHAVTPAGIKVFVVERPSRKQ